MTNAQNPILVSSNLILDEIWLANGDLAGLYPGGAALWAAIGARAFWPEVEILAGVGADFESSYGEVFSQLDLSRSALNVRQGNCIRSSLRYETEEQRRETPQFGADHFQEFQTLPSQNPNASKTYAGTYIFRDLWPEFWAEIEDNHGTLGVIIWELQGDVASPPNWNAIKENFDLVDAFSINIQEAQALGLGQTPLEAAQNIHAAGARIVFVRAGAEGAVVLGERDCFQVLAPKTHVEDTTGGGNAFTGGMLAGLARGTSLKEAAQYGAASAAIALSQFGVPSKIDPNDAIRLAETAQIINLEN